MASDKPETTDTRELMQAEFPAESGEGKVIGATRSLLVLVVKALVRKLDVLADGLMQLSVSQTATNDRMEAMEKQMRLHTPVTPKQVRCFNDVIRATARELLIKRGAEGDRKATTLLCNTIRKAVLMRYGVAALHEIPRHEYPVVIVQIETWNDALCVRDVLKRARGDT